MMPANSLKPCGCMNVRSCKHLPLSLWLPGWWGERCQGPRRYILPHARAPVTRLCTLSRRRPRRGLSGRWSSWQSGSRPDWDGPFSPTPCGPWKSSHSSCKRSKQNVFKGQSKNWKGKLVYRIKRIEKWITYPVATSHILIVLSLEADTMWSPFGIMATDDTLWSWPGRTDNGHRKWGTLNLKSFCSKETITIYILFLW